MDPISLLWRAARDLDPTVVDENDLPGAREGDLERLCHAAGLARVEGGVLSVSMHHESFDQWWEPYTLGVGPAGAYVKSLDEEHRAALREHCRELLPQRSFDITPTCGRCAPRREATPSRPRRSREPAGRHTDGAVTRGMGGRRGHTTPTAHRRL